MGEARGGARRPGEQQQDLRRRRLHAARRTSIVSPDGVETVLWGDRLGESPERLTHVQIRIVGLPKGAKVRVLFEDRSVIAADGYFEDDFRGEDLYQRYGGADGYGDTPVALHLYEVP
jgi:hypothetical protein